MVEAHGQTQSRVRLPVLMYHRVAPAPPDKHAEFTVSPAGFEHQLGWLASHGYRSVRPSDWLAWLCDGKALPGKPVLLTFDDAHAALAEYAFPMLRRYGFVAAAYVVTAYVGKTNVWDEAAGWGPYRLMTAEQIRQWAAEGIEFGAHSRTHPDLRALHGSRLAEEIAGSRQDLEQILGGPVSSFAYPYGLYDEAVRDCVREHYELAWTTKGGLNDIQTDPHALRRTMVLPADSGLNFSFRVRVGWTPGDFFSWLKGRTVRVFRSGRR